MPGYTLKERIPHWRGFVLVLIASLMVLSGQSLVNASTAAINQAQNEAQALQNLIDELNQQLEGATEDYDYANQQLEDSQGRATKLSADLKQAENDLASTQEKLNQRVVDIYKSGNLGMLDVVLDANSFSELVTRLDDLSLIGKQDAQLLSQISDFKTKISDQKTQLDAEMAQEKTYAAQTATAKQKVLAQLTKQTQSLKGKETQIAQLEKAEAARQAKLRAEAIARQKWLASRPGVVVSTAMKYLGVAYVWGGSSPSGFDCSGLVRYCYAKIGISLPHSSRLQISYGKPVSRSQVQVGDLMFYYTPIQHVGIYIGDGKIINATGNHVQISEAFTGSWVGACRLL